MNEAYATKSLNNLVTVGANVKMGQSMGQVGDLWTRVGRGLFPISLQSHHPSNVFAGAFLGYSIAHCAVLHAR